MYSASPMLSPSATSQSQSRPFPKYNLGAGPSPSLTGYTVNQEIEESYTYTDTYTMTTPLGSYQSPFPSAVSIYFLQNIGDVRWLMIFWMSLGSIVLLLEFSILLGLQDSRQYTTATHATTFSSFFLMWMLLPIACLGLTCACSFVFWTYVMVPRMRLDHVFTRRDFARMVKLFSGYDHDVSCTCVRGSIVVPWVKQYTNFLMTFGFLVVLLMIILAIIVAVLLIASATSFSPKDYMLTIVFFLLHQMFSRGFAYVFQRKEHKEQSILKVWVRTIFQTVFLSVFLPTAVFISQLIIAYFFSIRRKNSGSPHTAMIAVIRSQYQAYALTVLTTEATSWVTLWMRVKQTKFSSYAPSYQENMNASYCHVLFCFIFPLIMAIFDPYFALEGMGGVLLSSVSFYYRYRVSQNVEYSRINLKLSPLRDDAPTTDQTEPFLKSPEEFRKSHLLEFSAMTTVLFWSMATLSFLSVLSFSFYGTRALFKRQRFHVQQFLGVLGAPVSAFLLTAVTAIIPTKFTPSQQNMPNILLAEKDVSEIIHDADHLTWVPSTKSVNEFVLCGIRCLTYSDFLIGFFSYKFRNSVFLVRVVIAMFCFWATWTNFAICYVVAGQVAIVLGPLGFIPLAVWMFLQNVVVSFAMCCFQKLVTL